MTAHHDTLDVLLEAASFAARAHRHQLRKDGITPYAAHPFRVCLIVRHVFDIDDPKVLAAALLHDIIEDTPTDFDDLSGRFGPEVAGWVAALTKDMRLPEDEREVEYHRILAAADWPVVICKLADIYDNLTDSKSLSAGGRERSIRRSSSYLQVLRKDLPGAAARALAIVERKLAEVQASLPGLDSSK
jgi:guanosine-3',5'-bis(diphosphate) 3'-pyrophosphohydrolase